MAVSAAQIKELRELTGAGVLDCRKTLEATDGDLEKAAELLRERGLAAAARPRSRSSSAAFSRSPLVASSVLRQSSTPAPVSSRSSLIWAAETAMEFC